MPNGKEPDRIKSVVIIVLIIRTKDINNGDEKNTRCTQQEEIEALWPFLIRAWRKPCHYYKSSPHITAPAVPGPAPRIVSLRRRTSATTTTTTTVLLVLLVARNGPVRTYVRFMRHNMLLRYVRAGGLLRLYGMRRY
jgi:hypothetical protein